ncbi:MAG: hypothetical protein FWE58_03485 [Methanobrevibacter sp.]|nr:hypothetical protein [Methanobrevibacter sp.]
MNKHILGILVIICVIFVSGCVSPDSDSSVSSSYNVNQDQTPSAQFVELNLDKNPISISLNDTECVINGTTDGDIVTIDCPTLNISNVTVNPVDGFFSYKVKNIPQNGGDVYKNYTAKDAGKNQSIRLKVAKLTITAESKNPQIHDNDRSLEIIRIIAPEEIEKNFKESSKIVTYEELVKKNPYNFAKVRVKYSGEVTKAINNPLPGFSDLKGFKLAIDGDRNNLIHFYYNSNKTVQQGDNLTVWGEISGDMVYGPKEIDEWMKYSGTSLTYGGYNGFSYSPGSVGIISLRGNNPYYSDSYTSLGDYKFQPDAYLWYLEKND